MSVKIQTKRSSVANKAPQATALEVGELAVNLADQKLYTKDGSNNVILLADGTKLMPDGTAAGQFLKWDDTRKIWVATSDIKIDSSGNVTVAGKVVAATAPTADGDLVNKKHFDDNTTLQKVTDQGATTTNAVTIGAGAPITAAGTAKLQVNGTSYFHGNMKLEHAGIGRMTINCDSPTGASDVMFQSNGATVGIVGSNGTDLTIDNRSKDGLLFAQSASPRARLTSDGTFVLSASGAKIPAAGTAKLQVAGSIYSSTYGIADSWLSRKDVATGADIAYRVFNGGGAGANAVYTVYYDGSTLIGGPNKLGGGTAKLQVSGDTFIQGQLLAAQAGAGTAAFAAGFAAGEVSQGKDSTAVGPTAGRFNQGASSVAIGVQAARGDKTDPTAGQGTNAVAIGNNAGRASQGDSSIAIGHLAGGTNQGSNSVAIGNLAGETGQGANGIIISSVASALDDTTAGHIHIKSTIAELSYTGGKWSVMGGPVGINGKPGTGAGTIGGGTAKLQVAGGGYFIGSVNPRVYVASSVSATAPGFSMKAGSNSGWSMIADGGKGNEFRIDNGASNAITANANAASIGIGGTPGTGAGTIGGGTAKLQVNGSGYFSSAIMSGKWDATAAAALYMSKNDGILSKANGANHFTAYVGGRTQSNVVARIAHDGTTIIGADTVAGGGTAKLQVDGGAFLSGHLDAPVWKRTKHNIGVALTNHSLGPCSLLGVDLPGVVDLGATSSTFKDGFFSGTVSSGGVALTSDARLKSDIQERPVDTAVFQHITPKTYTKDGQKELGIIAQHLEAHFPDAVITADGNEEEGTDTKYISLGAANAILFGAMAEMHKKYEELEARLSALESN